MSTKTPAVRRERKRQPIPANNPTVGRRLLRDSIIRAQRRRVADVMKAIQQFRAKVARRLSR